MARHRRGQVVGGVALVYFSSPELHYCPMCRRSLPIAEFYRNAGNQPDGVSAYCRFHSRQKQNEYQQRRRLAGRD